VPPPSFSASISLAAKGEWCPGLPSGTYSFPPEVRNLRVLYVSLRARNCISVTTVSDWPRERASNGSNVPPKQTSITRKICSHGILLISERKRSYDTKD